MTAQVQAQKQKLEIEQKEPLYFCCKCDQLITEDKKTLNNEQEQIKE
jgi:hypothetical protein